jgi:oligopeptide/dipeptide ABC transporter ATP-binding protein
MNRQREPILEVKDLTVSFHDGSNRVDIVQKVSFTLYSHETLALVGESGCGKSLTAQAIIGLFSSNSVSISGGEIIFCGENILQKGSEMQKIRGRSLSFIQQNPLNSLNPTLTIGTQLIESIKIPSITTKRQKKAASLEMLKLVGISDGEKRLKAYPHELSGGMRQRVLIAIALINRPKLLIADEPTTALDVTIQAQILELLTELQGKTGTSILFITHDMGAVARIANRVAVMYGGKIVEMGSANEIFYTPQHPYTQLLLTCLPRLDIPRREPKPILGAPPLPGQFKTMCPFLPRCPYAMKICAQESPRLFGQTHQFRCWKALTVEANP